MGLGTHTPLENRPRVVPAAQLRFLLSRAARDLRPYSLLCERLCVARSRVQLQTSLACGFGIGLGCCSLAASASASAAVASAKALTNRSLDLPLACTSPVGDLSFCFGRSRRRHGPRLLAASAKTSPARSLGFPLARATTDATLAFTSLAHGLHVAFSPRRAGVSIGSV